MVVVRYRASTSQQHLPRVSPIDLDPNRFVSVEDSGNIGLIDGRSHCCLYRPNAVHLFAAHCPDSQDECGSDANDQFMVETWQPVLGAS